MSDPSEAWRALLSDAEAAQGRSILSLFDTEAGRLEGLTVEAAGLTLDLSKQPWSMAGFVAAGVVAGRGGAAQRRRGLFSGPPTNPSEARALRHRPRRAPPGANFWAKGEP